MPGMQPIDRDVLTGFRLGDERALEQVFRARYEPLTEQASAALGEDGAAAPKVVEGAFVRVWGERGAIDTPEALEEFLFDAVKTGAARERSRRAAAHRFGGGANNGHHATTHSSAAPVTLDDAWQHVSTALHATHAPSARVQDELHDVLRHDAATHVAALAKRPAWQLPTAIAVILAVAIFGAFRWMDRASADQAVTSALASPDGRNVSTLAAQSGRTTLNDGSKVTIGADTKIRIPPNFGPRMRAVRLDGSASFDAVAAESPQHPLIVRAGDASIAATAASSFDVRSYPGDQATTVRVRSGSVDVKSLSTGATQTAAAGQAVAVTKDGQVSTPSAADLSEAFGWADKKFVVNNRQLSAVLPQLVRWYGLEFKTPDQSILARPVTMTASLESSREAIAALEKAANVQFGWEGKTMTLTPKK
ncbi:FecR protein [Gemmatirosa kalamazoonensis]|uniref:FecR protein n=1 Tax=Gemmatirosa kalamazoonensis TaxID=861299 RepID=W0RDX3_9BACT|nr:FecR domain-containing protein [Gemmatirosa kalamazoonensis]AHG89006.1 FecR protein [Gemmatirosa kalamazoonensis]